MFILNNPNTKLWYLNKILCLSHMYGDSDSLTYNDVLHLDLEYRSEKAGLI